MPAIPKSTSDAAFSSIGSVSDAAASGELPSFSVREDDPSGSERSRRDTGASEPRLSSLDVTLGEKLGSGSYGTVYSATTVRHGTVAVKVLPWGPNDISSELKHELKLLQRCTSPHVVKALGAFSKPQELWIVMELCPHGSLLDVLRTIERPFTEGERALACRDALRGLEYMHTHRKGIIHRDVKCANLLLGDGIVKLADFGVAVQLNSTASKRSSVIGTPHWMAPEVVQNGRYDQKADVWSLGISAIEMAQGEPPHAELRPILRVMFTIAAQPPPTLREPERASALFNDFVARLLVKEAKERPSSTEMLQHPFVQPARPEAVPSATAARNEAAAEEEAGCSLRGLARDYVAAVAYRLAHPPAEAARTVSHDSLNWGGSTCGGTLVGQKHASSDSVGGGADASTFVYHGTAPGGGAVVGTFVYHGTGPADGAAYSGTFVQHGTCGGGSGGDAPPTPLPWMRAASTAPPAMPPPAPATPGALPGTLPSVLASTLRAGRAPSPASAAPDDAAVPSPLLPSPDLDGVGSGTLRSAALAAAEDSAGGASGGAAGGGGRGGTQRPRISSQASDSTTTSAFASARDSVSARVDADDERDAASTPAAAAHAAAARDDAAVTPSAGLARSPQTPSAASDEPSPALSAAGSPAFAYRQNYRAEPPQPPQPPPPAAAGRSPPPLPHRGSFDDAEVHLMRKLHVAPDGPLAARLLPRSASDDALYEHARAALATPRARGATAEEEAGCVLS